jgi:hypothetical protein
MASIVTKTALSLFRETGRRAKSSEIEAVLRKDGVKFYNKKPQAQIASILSHNPLLDNTGDSRGSGYGLREWSDSRNEQQNAEGSRGTSARAF